MRHYCTLADRAYLPKALALYDSLLQHSHEAWTLHFLAMDEESFWLMSEMNRPRINVIPASSFIQWTRLESVQRSRTHQEWCWTAASQWMEYLLPSVDAVTYIDADCLFFSDPEVVFHEIGERSIAITPHRLIADKKHLEVNGQFNVGWVTFRNNPTGQACAERWARQTREWCFNRIEEDHACGDQKYLDEWPALYGDECAVIQNIGVNVAPWNLANWRLTQAWTGHPLVDNFPIVMFHAHEFKEGSSGSIQYTNYRLRPEDIDFIYKPYLNAYHTARRRIREAELIRSHRLEQLALEGERA